MALLLSGFRAEGMEELGRTEFIADIPLTHAFGKKPGNG